MFRNRTPWLERVRQFLWLLFLVWTAIGAIVMPFDIGPVQIRQWIYAEDLQRALIGFLGFSDAIWIVLAAALAYLALVEEETLPIARRWALIILVSSGALETMGTLTGFPFGPYVYTARFGWRILGVLPFTIPLAWLIVVVCARFAILTCWPRASRWGLALGTGFIALLTDLNLEPIAWKVRAYWIWYPTQQGAQSHPPLQNYVTWFTAASALALLFPDRAVNRGTGRRPWQPSLILLLMNGLFLLVHLTRWLRNP